MRNLSRDWTRPGEAPQSARKIGGNERWGDEESATRSLPPRSRWSTDNGGRRGKILSCASYIEGASLRASPVFANCWTMLHCSSRYDWLERIVQADSNILNLVAIQVDWRNWRGLDFEFFLFLAPFSFLSLSINRKKKKNKRNKKRTNLSECEYARPRINSANNHRGRQGRKRNDRRAAEGRTRRKDEWKKRRGNSADHSLWLCSWLSRSSSFIHASTVPSMVFLPCGSAIYRGLLLYCNPTLNAFRPRSSLAKTFSLESRMDLLRRSFGYFDELVSPILFKDIYRSPLDRCN